MECKYHTNKPPWKGKGGMRCTSGDLEIGSPKHRSPGNQNHPTTQQLETGSSLVYYLVFHHCEKMPAINSLQRGKVCCGSLFQLFHLSPSLCACGMMEHHGEVKLFKSWWLRSKERNRRGRAPNIPSNCISQLSHFPPLNSTF
jgi:hypothetical protein